MNDYIILLPPSEGKNLSGNQAPLHFEQLLYARESEKIAKELVVSMNTNANKLEKMLEMKGKNLQQSIQINKDIFSTPTLPAIQRYSGIMFQAIDYNSFSEDQKRHFNSSVFFIDGLFGILRGNDLIPNYKCKITTKLSKTDLTKYWKEVLSNNCFKEMGEKLIIDLLPESHRKVIPQTNNTIMITFGEEKDTRFKQAGHHSKKLKGNFIRYLLSYEQIDRKQLESYEHPEGYIYSDQYSNAKRIVYCKKS